MKDGLFVGVLFKTYLKEELVCLPGQSVTTYYTYDDDGVGGSSREDICSLVCI